MNKKLINLLISIAFLFIANPVFAAFVEFEQTPLFNEAHLVPGNTVTRYINVSNNTESSQIATIEAINQSDPDNFSSKLILEIKEGATVIFKDTMKKFFTNGENRLSTITNGSTIRYDLTMSFDQTSDNSFQGKKLSFDLLVGFQGQEGGSTDNGGGGSTGGGGGGGGGSIPAGLTIRSENNTCLCGTDENKVEITWATNYFSTSAVIYDTEPNKFIYANGEPKFGYSYYKEGDASGLDKVTSHTVILTDLVPGQTYYYRVVSHASPATIGQEGTFKFNCSPKEEVSQQVTEQPEPIVEGNSSNFISMAGSSQQNSNEEGLIDEQGGENNGNEDPKIDKEDDSNNLQANLLAALANLGSNGVWPWLILVVILLFLYLIFYYLEKKKKKKE